MKPKVIPKVMLMMKPVDGGAAMIGVIECPNCGQEHFTTNIECGDRRIFCGTGGPDSPVDGWSWVSVERII